MTDQQKINALAASLQMALQQIAQNGHWDMYRTDLMNKELDACECQQVNSDGTIKSLIYGRLLVFEKLQSGDLKMTLTELGKNEVIDMLKDKNNKIRFQVRELLESQLFNGWDIINPVDILGSDSDILILSDNVEYTDGGEFYCCASHYSHDIKTIIQELNDVGEIIFKGWHA